MVTPPCKSCSDRNTFCHTSCEKYKAYRQNKDIENEKHRKEQTLFYALQNTEIERSRKIKRRPRR